MNKGKIIDLSQNQITNKKKEYDLNDKNICSVQLDKNIKVALIENEKGKYVDIRKYYNEYPTKKGIRIEASVFKTVVESLKDELDNIK